MDIADLLFYIFNQRLNVGGNHNHLSVQIPCGIGRIYWKTNGKGDGTRMGSNECLLGLEIYGIKGRE